jgi:hypothetical protein
LNRGPRLAAAAVFVAALVLGGYVAAIYFQPHAAKVAAAPNVQVDSLAPGASFPWAYANESVQGVQPSVAVGAGGQVYASWIGFSTSSPQVYPSSARGFRTQILFSASTDGGKSYSAAVEVSNSTNPLSYSCFDPSTAVAPNGTLAYVAYACYSQGGFATTIFVAAGSEGPSGDFSFTQNAVSVGVGFSSPWMVVSKSGVVYLAWDSSYELYWATVRPNMTIGRPSSNTFPTEYGWTTGAALLPNGTMAVVAYGYGRPNAANSTISVLYAPLSRDGHSGNLGWTSVANLTVPSSMYIGGAVPFVPGPALTITSGGTPYIAYASDVGHSLLLTWLTPGGQSWSSPVVLGSSQNGTVESPALASGGIGVIVAAWMGNATGAWDAYVSAYQTSASKLAGPIKLNSAPGFASGPMTWHGDFMSVAQVSGSRFVVLWSDGRGVPDYYGYGHIYSSLVSVS